MQVFMLLKHFGDLATLVWDKTLGRLRGFSRRLLGRCLLCGDPNRLPGRRSCQRCTLRTSSTFGSLEKF